MFLNTVVAFNQKITTQVRDSLRLAPALKRKPKVLRFWLFSARKAQITILALLVLLLLVIMPGLDLLLSKIFSPVTITSLFGLVHSEVENPDLQVSQMITHWLLWIGMVLVAVYLYLRHIPVAMESARNIAREKEHKADQLANINPSESILLYDAARDWSCDEETESKIKSKLQQLNARMSQVNGSSTPGSATTRPDETVILNSGGQESESKQAIIADRYQIKRQLGAGAMGIVYQAQDLKLNRDVALKQLAPSLANDAQLLARFRQEAQALARLSHPNIVQVYDFIDWNGLSFIVMEFVDGNELETRLGHGKPLKLAVALRLAIQMAAALGYAHERGVVHRDFKPANVLVSDTGKIKITDFGIAKLATSSMHTQLNTVMGSPAYMSPEQANGDPTDQRTDIYALGIVLFQLLTGKRPFDGDMKSIIAQHLSKVPDVPSKICSGIPPILDEIVQTMLAKQAEDRYSSMAEVIGQLKKVIT